ncbi:hypothetical protein M0805_001658 [Coniferiporia weirii]|nr:hypothetical protein M0805_001658 [Coniferiporia weirii]
MAPLKMKAIISVSLGNVELDEVDVPRPGLNEILVKVVATAQNPTDWKTADKYALPRTIMGCDYSGIVEELGSEVFDGTLKVGDRVAGFVHGGAHRNGAFSEYIVTPAALTIRIPDSWTFEQAAQLAIAGFTACMCLYYAQDLPSPLASITTPTDILVWGGSSSVGQYTVQLTHLAGLRVIATSSPRNFDLLKSLGADLVFSYSDPETPSKIREATSGKLKHVVDCISEGDTPDKVAQSVGDEGGDVSIILVYKSKREDIKTKHVWAYMLLGKAIEIRYKRPADPEQHAFGIKAAKLLSEVLQSGKIKSGPMKLMPNGLASVKDGFEYMRSGKVSGEKITYRISDTPL